MINGMILIFKKQILPFLDGDVPHSPSYSVYISQLIRFARVCSNVDDLINVALSRGAMGLSAVCDCGIS